MAAGSECKIFLATVFFAGIRAFQWTSELPDRSVRYTCEASELLLPWNLLLGPGEQISSITWFLKDDFGQHPIATFFNGMFVALTDNGRLVYNGNASLILNHVLPADKGNYSVEISFHTGATHLRTERRSVEVLIGEPPSAVGGELRMRQETVAVYSNDHFEYEVQLACGQFTRLGDPSVSVVWTIPRGSLPSTSYDNGVFRLALQNPIRGGDYMCSLPTSNAAVVCLSPSSKLLLTSRMTLNLTQALTTLQLAPQIDIREQNSQLRDQMEEQLHKVHNDSSYVRGLEDAVQTLQQELCSPASGRSSPAPLSGT